MALTPEEMQEIIKDTFEELGSRTYVGMRYIPKFVGDWSASNEYESLVIVEHNDTLYLSKQYVPVGVEITNTTFWVHYTGSFDIAPGSITNDMLSPDIRMVPISESVIDSITDEEW